MRLGTRVTLACVFVICAAAATLRLAAIYGYTLDQVCARLPEEAHERECDAWFKRIVGLPEELGFAARDEYIDAFVEVARTTRAAAGSWWRLLRLVGAPIARFIVILAPPAYDVARSLAGLAADLAGLAASQSPTMIAAEVGSLLAAILVWRIAAFISSRGFFSRARSRVHRRVGAMRDALSRRYSTAARWLFLVYRAFAAALPHVAFAAACVLCLRSTQLLELTVSLLPLVSTALPATRTLLALGGSEGEQRNRRVRRGGGVVALRVCGAGGGVASHWR